MRAPTRVAGRRFGRLVVLERKGQKAFCRCDCGTTKWFWANNVGRGAIGCGCLVGYVAPVANQAKRKLGPTRESPIGRVWSGMMARCFNSKHRSYPAYGGRGISVVLAWRTLEGFAAGMGERPAGAQIDRIDNSKGYEPGNCRWVTTRQQNHNRTNVTLIEIDGITESAPWWAENCGLSAVCILDRYTRGLRGRDLLQPSNAYQTRHNAKLSSSQVEDIRRAYAEGGTTLKGLAVAYGVSKSATYMIVKGKTYRGSAYRVEGVR